MTVLLDRSPIPSEPGEIAVYGERVRVRRDQIVVWVSLSQKTRAGLNLPGRTFPAILDTGHNHSFSINERLLNQWCGLSIETLEGSGAIRERNQRVPLRYANLWIHVNLRGDREKLADVEPYLLTAKLGIAVYPGGDFPRLPILGLRAITENGLILNVDGSRRKATLRTTRWWEFW